MKFFAAGLVSCFMAGFLFPQGSSLDAAYIRITDAYQQGRLSYAEEQLRVLLKASPSEVRACSLMGVVLDAEKRYQEAEQYYLKAIELAPGAAALHNNLGNHYAAQKDFAKAQVAFLRAVAIAPRHPNANLQLAQIDVQNREYAGALRRLAVLPASDQNAPAVQVLRARALFGSGRKEEARKLLQQLAASAAGDLRTTFALGMAYAEVELYPQAEEAFTQVLKADPANFEVLYNLATAALRAGHLERAEAIYRQALEQQPKDIDSLVGLARALAGSRQGMEALSLLVQANGLAPSRSDILLLTAQTADATGLYGDCATAYDRYLKLQPGDDEARRERGYALARSSRLKEAIQDLDWYVRKHPNDASGHFKLAVALSLEDKPKALEEINRALQIDPKFWPARYARGVLSQRLGHNQQAVEDLKACVERDQSNVQMQEELARALMSSGQPDQAAAILEKAIAAAPENGSLYFRYSRALSALGRKDEMSRAIAKFEQLGGGRENSVPHPGVLEFLTLPPADQQVRYLENLRSAIVQRPGDFELKLRLLEALFAQGKEQEADPVLETIARSSNDSRILASCARLLVDAGHYDKALPFLEKAIERGTAPSVTYLDRALAYLEIAGPGKALEALDSIPATGRDGNYFLLRAQILDALGNFDKAVEALNQALGSAPSRADLYLEACAFLLKHKRYDECLALLDKADQHVPGSAELQLARAIALEMSNRTVEASKRLSAIEAQWPDWAAPYVIHGIVLQSQHQAAEAKQLLETGIALGSRDPSAYYHLCLAIKDLTPGDNEAAYKIVARGLEIDPQDPYMAAQAGRVALDMKRYDMALRHLQDAVRLYPEMADAHWLLASLYRITGQDQNQQAELAEVKRLNALFPPGTQLPPSTQDLLFSVRRPGKRALQPSTVR
jgi:tetratricopeptide (TPR) repeat protein